MARPCCHKDIQGNARQRKPTFYADLSTDTVTNEISYRVGLRLAQFLVVHALVVDFDQHRVLAVPLAAFLDRAVAARLIIALAIRWLKDEKFE